MAKKLSLLILSIILVLVILSTTTYALFFKQDKLVNTEEYTSGILDIVLDNDEEGLGEVLTLTNSIPMSDDEGKISTPYKFKITNQGNLSYTFDLKIVSTTVSNAINSDYIKVMIDEDEPVTLSSLTEGVIKSNITLAPSNSITIQLRVWLDEYTPNTEIGKSFSAKIVTDGVASEPLKIASQELIKLSKGNTWESGANGLYEVSYTKEDGTTIGKDYRYIGVNVSNYVNFNNDMYQIIGIFDENTHGIEDEYLVKLVSVNKIATASYGIVNDAKKDGSYAGVHNDWTGKNNSTPTNMNILLNQYFLNKTDISTTYGNCSNWTYFYNNNDYKTKDCQTLVGYGLSSNMRDYIETVTWHLNGMITATSFTANNYYLCERGLYSECTSANNGAGDTKTNAKIGLMYPSDLLYASGYRNSSSTLNSSSDYNANQNWIYDGSDWSITPSSYSISSSSPDKDGWATVISEGCGLGSVEASFGVRPSFYLKSNIKITGGEGTFENPYTLSE